MRAMTLEKLLNYTDDQELLNIFEELESGKIPNTSYAHAFCRKVNRMIDNGELRVGDKSYRHMYLPTLSKAVYKEMARRFAIYMNNYKARLIIVGDDAEDEDEDEVHKCAWCELEFESGQLIPTDLGMLCERCISAIRSRGEQVMTLA